VTVLLDITTLSTGDVLRVFFLGAIAAVAAYYIGRGRGREQGYAEGLLRAEEQQRARERYERGQRRWEEVKKARAEGREPDWDSLLRDDPADDRMNE
jgi:hypothetical protein